MNLPTLPCISRSSSLRWQLTLRSCCIFASDAVRALFTSINSCTVIGPSERSDDSELCGRTCPDRIGLIHSVYKLNKVSLNILIVVSFFFFFNLGPSISAAVPTGGLLYWIFIWCHTVVIRLVIVLTLTIMAAVYSLKDQLHTVWRRTTRSKRQRSNKPCWLQAAV